MGFQTKSRTYEEFVEKFKPKLTTDDCYTPPVVFDAVASWVCRRYGIDSSKIVRPFWPGGDYKLTKYPEGCVVIDNPPFSILAEIIKWYDEKGVRFFLFAPTLTLFSSSSSSSSSSAIPCGASITYENGAKVNTSFLTNLEPSDVRAVTYPDLYEVVASADEFNRHEKTVPLPKYSYPDEIVTAAMMARWSKLGIKYTLKTEDSMHYRALDSQRAEGKVIYGSGYLLSERAAAERAAAERAAAERAAAERAAARPWPLSERERQIVRRLGRRHG